MVLGKGDIHMQKDEVGPLLHTTYKNSLKMNFVLNVRVKTIKLLKENTGVNFPDLGLDHGLLHMTSKAKAKKKKKVSWTLKCKLLYFKG